MATTLKEMLVFEDVHEEHGLAGIQRTASPTLLYSLLSSILVAFSLFWVAALFSRVAESSFGMAAADLVIQANFAAFLVVAFAMFLAPLLRLQKIRVRLPSGDRNAAHFRFQEALLVSLGVLFFNIPLLFIANAIALFKEIQAADLLGGAGREFLIQSVPFYQIPEMSDVWVCAVFGLVLLVVKGLVFRRVLRRQQAVAVRPVSVA